MQSGLDTKAMMHSEKGMSAIPGKNVRQKAGFNRETLVTGSGAIRQALDYKAGTSSKFPPPIGRRHAARAVWQTLAPGTFIGIRVHGLRSCTERGSERSPQYPGIGGGRTSTERHASHHCDS